MNKTFTAEQNLQQQYRGFINTPQLWFGQYESLTQFELPKLQTDSYAGEPIPVSYTHLTLPTSDLV